MESILIILVVILVTWYFSKTPKEDNIIKEEKPLLKNNEPIKCMRKDCKRYAYPESIYCDNCIDNMFLS